MFLQECWLGPGASRTLSHCLTCPLLPLPHFVSEQTHASPHVSYSGFFIAEMGQWASTIPSAFMPWRGHSLFGIWALPIDCSPWLPFQDELVAPEHANSGAWQVAGNPLLLWSAPSLLGGIPTASPSQRVTAELSAKWDFLQPLPAAAEFQRGQFSFWFGKDDEGGESG